MMYEPDGWLILKFTDKNNEQNFFHKIFGSWSGNFSTGDSWHLSSGILNIDSGVDDKNYIDWPQESGSVYRLYKQREGKLSLYNCLSAPKNLIKKSLTQIPIFDLLLIFG